MGPLPRVHGQRGDVHGKQTFFKFGIPRCLGVLQCEVQKKNGNSRGGWCCFFSYFFFGGFIHLNATIRTTGFVMINFFPRNCGKIWANTKVWQCVALIPLKRRFFHSELLSFYLDPRPYPRPANALRLAALHPRRSSLVEPGRRSRGCPAGVGGRPRWTRRPPGSCPNPCREGPGSLMTFVCC